jgi:hypothetical protein
VNINHTAVPSGVVSLQVIKPARTPISLELFRRADPSRVKSGINTGLNWLRRYKEANLSNILRGLEKVRVAEQHGLPIILGTLDLRRILGHGGDQLDFGLVSTRVVTTAGVNFLVDALQGTVEPEILKYHGFGTGTNAEASGDTALQAEVTTGLNPDSTRATGSLGEGASANIFRTVGTSTFDASLAITEHGILSQAATGGGTLWDRSVFPAVNVVATDQIQATYDATFAAGS